MEHCGNIVALHIQGAAFKGSDFQQRVIVGASYFMYYAYSVVWYVLTTCEGLSLLDHHSVTRLT